MIVPGTYLPPDHAADFLRTVVYCDVPCAVLPDEVHDNVRWMLSLALAETPVTAVIQEML